MSDLIERSGPPLPDDARLAEPLTEIFHSAARERPDADFLVSLSTPEESRSFAAFNEEAVAVARALVARGVKPGDRISILSENRPRWCVAYVAVLHAGGGVGVEAAGAALPGIAPVLTGLRPVRPAEIADLDVADARGGVVEVGEKGVGGLH